MSIDTIIKLFKNWKNVVLLLTAIGFVGCYLFISNLQSEISQLKLKNENLTLKYNAVVSDKQALEDAAELQSLLQGISKEYIDVLVKGLDNLNDMQSQREEIMMADKPTDIKPNTNKVVSDETKRKGMALVNSLHHR